MLKIISKTRKKIAMSMQLLWSKHSWLYFEKVLTEPFPPMKYFHSAKKIMYNFDIYLKRNIQTVIGLMDSDIVFKHSHWSPNLYQAMDFAVFVACPRLKPFGLASPQLAHHQAPPPPCLSRAAQLSGQLSWSWSKVVNPIPSLSARPSPPFPWKPLTSSL